jgi:hypothetical protein
VEAPIRYKRYQIEARATSGRYGQKLGSHSKGRAFIRQKEDYMLKIALEPGPSAFLAGSDGMVDLQKDRYVLQCDACDELFEGAEEYTDVWNRAKAEGWEARQVSGRSVLVCPYCASPGND